LEAELQRQDIRYKREQQREWQRAELDRALHWREERLSAYSDFLGAFVRYCHDLEAVLFQLWQEHPLIEEHLSQIDGGRLAVSEQLARIHMIASESTYEDCVSALSEAAELAIAIRLGGWREKEPIHPSGSHGNLIKATRSARQALRRDLVLETNEVSGAESSDQLPR
jgi:hypothetical protein